MLRRQFVRAGLSSPFLLAANRTMAQVNGRAAITGGEIGIHPPSKGFLATLPRLEDLSRTPGVGIGVVRNGKADWQHFDGLADSVTGRRIAADSIFPAASMGKTIFAYAVLMLADEGRIDLDRPIANYLADDAPTGQWGALVTARHCLSHSTGLPNWRQNKDERLVPSFEPGSKWQYSGEGYYTLQRCVENITGIGFEQFIQDKLLIPLGMTSSTYIWRDDFPNRVVIGNDFANGSHSRWSFPAELLGKIKDSGIPLKDWNHKRVSEAMTKQSAPLATNIYPNCAFSLLTTVGDYTRFAARLATAAGDNLDLKLATRAEMFRPFVRVNSALSWGIGMGVEQEGRQRLNFQWGDNGFWKNMVMVHPDTRSAVVVFTNGECGMRVVERVINVATGLDNAVFVLL